MSVRKKSINPSIGKAASETMVSQIKHPLIFISHDTRDGELAEEFSNLLKSASSGALNSFRSSDKKGTQGIEYGQEWYPAIMEKIDEASDVVCLLTQNSVDRPWILYEAGVAKGKLDKKVIGIALGIPLGVAITGPFAQFQNNDGDAESITKLVSELVRKVPGLDPVHHVVRNLVDDFIKRVKEITSKIKKLNEEPTIGKEDSVAKLFEEVKIMFESLPARIENRFDPDFRRKRRKFHPGLVEEFMIIGMESEDPLIGFLMFMGIFKDDFPWFHEIGLETYRGLKSAKTASERERIIRSFERAADMLSHPIFREFYGKNDDMYFFAKEGRHIIHRFLDRVFLDKKMKE